MGGRLWKLSYFYLGYYWGYWSIIYDLILDPTYYSYEYSSTILIVVWSLVPGFLIDLKTEGSGGLGPLGDSTNSFDLAILI